MTTQREVVFLFFFFLTSSRSNSCAQEVATTMQGGGGGTRGRAGPWRRQMRVWIVGRSPKLRRGTVARGVPRGDTMRRETKFENPVARDRTITPASRNPQLRRRAHLSTSRVRRDGIRALPATKPTVDDEPRMQHMLRLQCKRSAFENTLVRVQPKLCRRRRTRVVGGASTAFPARRRL
uniref:Putative secreted protein n=1 Tax=Ixodes ricinus TaxID=34613 RepID=A0A6B0UZ85_IXORI